MEEEIFEESYFVNSLYSLTDKNCRVKESTSPLVPGVLGISAGTIMIHRMNIQSYALPFYYISHTAEGRDMILIERTQVPEFNVSGYRARLT